MDQNNINEFVRLTNADKDVGTINFIVAAVFLNKSKGDLQV
jgi:hypothetical protein